MLLQPKAKAVALAAAVSTGDSADYGDRCPLCERSLRQPQPRHEDIRLVRDQLSKLHHLKKSLEDDLVKVFCATAFLGDKIVQIDEAMATLQEEVECRD